jgi:predicted CopG family antitoxin
MIDEKHYAFLKKKSEQEKKSISKILREIIESYSRKSNVYSLLSVSGIGEDSECYGKDHDKWLYGKE